MKTLKKQTRFMNGNIDIEGVIVDSLINEFGCNDVFSNGLFNEDTIYSDGFINAFNNGLMPILGSEHESFMPKKEDEYHHFISNDKCFVTYFK